MKRRYHIHLPAVLYVLLVLLVGVAAMNLQNNLLFWIFGLMFSGLLISGIVSGMMMLGIRIKRVDPAHVCVGEPMIVRYHLENRNRVLPVFNVHVEELPVHQRSEVRGQRSVVGHERLTSDLRSLISARNGWQNLMAKASAWVMHVGARETVHGEAVFWPQRRGEARFSALRVWTTFPFGLIKKSVTIEQPQHTLIYPRLVPLRRDVLRSIDTPGPVGTRITQRPGGTDDYFGLREYRENDSVRHIAWKRSAQIDQLVCIERSRPSPPRVRIVLDLTTPTEKLRVDAGEAVSARELEERAITLAASLIHHADIDGYEVGLTVLGAAAHSDQRGAQHYPVRRNHWHARRLLAALAAIELDAPRAAATVSLADAERAGIAVIRPDRAVPIAERPDITYFTGRQLDRLVLQS